MTIQVVNFQCYLGDILIAYINILLKNFYFNNQKKKMYVSNFKQLALASRDKLIQRSLLTQSDKTTF